MNRTILFFLISLSIACNTINASQADRFAKAAAADDQKTIIAMLNDGFDVDAPLNAKNGTALHIAAEYGSSNLVELLIMRGAVVDSRTDQGNTPLMLSKDSVVAKILIRHGADVKAQNEYRKTPLMWAAHRGDVDTVKLLLQHGADVNVFTKRRSAAHGSENAFDYAQYVGRDKKQNKEQIEALLKEAGFKGGLKKPRGRR